MKYIVYVSCTVCEEYIVEAVDKEHAELVVWSGCGGEPRTELIDQFVTDIEEVQP